MANNKPKTGASLSDWLQYIEGLHPASIELGLERVQQVKRRLNMTQNALVFTVAGTNGKGSTCAFLETILRQAGFSVGLYTSPHLIQFNERAIINGEPASDQQLIKACEQVEAARIDPSEIQLTYFEFTTLAIAVVFAAQKLDAWVLEVGLGGQLDAVNCFDADCAVCTSIDLDHQEFLGDSRELIGYEKAGVFRASKPAIVADPNPPQSVAKHALHIGADLWQIGKDFSFSGDEKQWNYRGRALNRLSLPYPALRGANQLLNAAAALAALEVMHPQLPVSAQAIRQGLLLVDLPGRFQVLPGKPATVLDVAHNPHAAAHLSASLENMGFFQNTHCIFGMLSDKDIPGVVQYLKGQVNHWHLVTLPGDRGMSSEKLQQVFQVLGIEDASFNWQANAKAAQQGGIPRQPPVSSLQKYDNVEQAYQVVSQAVPSSDRILICGSFVTVGLALQARANANKKVVQ